MADIPGALLKLNDIEVAQDAPDTESLWNKTGANINQLIDDDADHETRVTALESRATADEALIAAKSTADFFSGNSPSDLGDTGFRNIVSVSGSIKLAVFVENSIASPNITLLPSQTHSITGFNYRISGGNFQVQSLAGVSSISYSVTLIWV